MICKKCGAYNPDHATFCKVCAANLKEQTDTDEAAQVVEEEEAVDQEFRPKRGNVKAPDFSSARRAESFKAAKKVEETVEEEIDDGIEEEDVKPVSQKSAFTRPTALQKKRRVIDEDDEEDDFDDEDDYDEEDDVKSARKKSLFARPTKKARAIEEDEDEEEEDSDAEKLESEPATTRFTRPSAKKRHIEEDDDEDDEDEFDDEDDDDEDDDDDYEEYEPTPPRRKKAGRSQGKGNAGGSSIVAVLIVCLLAILLIIVGIIAFCNIKGGATKAKLPSFLQFNCAGKATTSTDRTTTPQQQEDVPSAAPETSEPTEAPVTGTQVDYAVTELKEIVDNEGRPCVSITVNTRPGDTLTVVFPNRDDYVVQNDKDVDQSYLLTIYKSDYYPNTPVEESTYTVTPQILVTHADGTQESLHVDSFDLTLPTVQLDLSEPSPASIPEDGIMAAEGNTVVITGTVDDHTVTVTVNGQPIDVYTGGTFDYTYTLSGDAPETITIEASKAAYVPTSYSFIAKPYVFIPEHMPLSVESNVAKLRADKNQKVTVTGMTAPGTTLTATPAEEYQTSVVCGAPIVDAEGRFSFEVTFDKYYYGIATINLHAKKEGYEEGEASCMVSRMYADQKSAVNGYSKTKSYHEVYKYYKFEEVMAAPSAAGLYRFAGKVTAVDPETGIITVDIEAAKGKTATIYVLNASDKWEPDKHVGDKYFLYCTLNGLYTDDASLYATAWFIKKTK